MTRIARLALACYPPSWQERYGAELAELTGDRRGVSIDLLLGAARAWMHPAGPRTLSDRRRSALGTVHVAWSLGFVAAGLYMKAVDDPPLPGLTTGASQPLWGVAKVAFFLGWLLLLTGGTALLLRIAVPAVRARQWSVLRPLLPCIALGTAALATVPVLARYASGSDSTAADVVIVVWLALLLAVVIAGAIGPVVSLRRSKLDDRSLRIPVFVAAAVTLAAAVLAAVALVQAAVLSREADAWNLLLMWVAVAGLLAAATTSAASVRRALSPA